MSDDRPRSGPHKVLVALYALFTLAAGARAAVQLITHYDEAPVAYWLSLVAAVTYALGWYAIHEASIGHTAFASVWLWIELGGVVVVSILSFVRPSWFPEPSVWSQFGLGYGFVPAALPIAGLIWLRTQKRTRVEL